MICLLTKITEEYLRIERWDCSPIKWPTLSFHLSLTYMSCCGTPDDVTISHQVAQSMAAFWDLPMDKPVHSFMLSSHLFHYLPLSWAADMTIPLQLMLCNGCQKVFEGANGCFDSTVHFSIGNMILVWDMQDLAEASHLHGLDPSL